MILRFCCWLVFLAVCCVALADVEVSTDEIEFGNNTFADNAPFQDEYCYCGIFSKSCSYVRGKKICICDDSYVDYAGICTECDCGEHGSCELKYFEKVCHCEKGYKLKMPFLNENSWKCEECDCGDNGECEFNRGYKECTCKPGFAEKEGTCDDCECGDNGICTFNEGNKQCDCNPGFSENYRGLCQECDCKIAESNCTIDGFQKKCQCPKGFKPTKNNDNPECIDIDECLKPEDNDCPPVSSKCVNTQGSYDCECKEGFQVIYENGYPISIKEYGCKDIDECLVYSPCIYLHTRCVNTPGSYRCECTDGFILEKDSFGEKYNYCSEDARPWKTASIVLGGVYGFVSLGLLVAICTKHASMG